MVRLARNKLERLAERTFEGLCRIELLDLEGNQLAELPDTVFERGRVHILDNINLARNQFEVAPLATLQRQYFFLSSVDLSGNRLVDIPADDTIMVNIKRLDLSFNPLSQDAVTNVLAEPKTVRQKLTILATQDYSYSDPRTSVDGPENERKPEVFFSGPRAEHGGHRHLEPEPAGDALPPVAQPLPQQHHSLREGGQ